MADPLTVPCPDCLAPTGTACHTSIGYLDGAHADRRRTADLRALEHGTCALCGNPMVRGTIAGSPVDAWHPDVAHAAACPPIPDARTDWNGYAEAVNAGASPGHPGLQHFQPLSGAGTDVVDLPDLYDSLTPEERSAAGTFTETPAPVCPECTAGKHPNCDGTAWDEVADAPTICACHTAQHPSPAPPPHTQRVATQDPFTPGPGARP